MGKETIKQPQGLVSVLIDQSARIDERDDAAMDLSAYDEPVAIAALVEVASDPRTPTMVRESCGESIAEIWYRNSSFDEELFKALTTEARNEVKHVFPRG